MMEGTGGRTVLSLRDYLHVKMLARKRHLSIRKLRIAFIYRISYSSKHPVTKGSFFEEFTTYFGGIPR